MRKIFSALALIALSSPVSAQGFCQSQSAEDCARMYEEVVSKVRRQQRFFGGEFTLESVKAGGKVITVTRRTYSSKDEFRRFQDLPGRLADKYLAALRRETIQHDCREPAASVIALGVRFKNVFYFKDGGLLDELVVSKCPAG